MNFFDIHQKISFMSLLLLFSNKKQMKTIINYAIITCLSLTIVRCTKQLSESIIDKKVGTNGSFENIKNNLPINWLVYTPNTTGEGNFDFTYDTENVKEGKQSLKLSVKTCSEKGGWHSPGIAQEISVNPNEEYKISFWLKNSESTFLINMNCVNATTESKHLTLKSSENISEWKYFEYNYKVPDKMNKLRIEMNVIKPGTFWIDDIKVEKL